jgi:hypothetical protein
MYFHLAANLAVTIRFIAVLLVLSHLAGNQSGATPGETCDETSKVPRYCADRSSDVIVKSDRSLHSDKTMWAERYLGGKIAVIVSNRRCFHRPTPTQLLTNAVVSMGRRNTKLEPTSH